MILPFKPTYHWWILLLLLVGGEAIGQATLIVPINGVQKTNGQLLYSLFQSADGFPDQPAKAYRTGSVPVTDRFITLQISALPPGTYALSVIHDENGNGKLDMSRLGIPSEPFGFSNNVTGAFGPPKFSRASFVLTPGKNERSIRLKVFP